MATLTWTPSLTNHSGTVLSARYIRISRLINFILHIRLTGASSGVIRFSLPVTASSNQQVGKTGILNTIGVGNILDAGTQRYDCSIILNSTTTADLCVYASGGSYTNPVDTSNTVPMTWANTDEYFVRGSYEAA